MKFNISILPRLLTFCMIFFSITFIFQSCKHGKGEPLYEEVMAIHDEVMPEMSTIHKLKKKLKKQTKPLDKETLTLISSLEAADESMMEWMAQFDPPKDAVERKVYLEGQLTAVKIMADEMKEAISMAQTYVDDKNL